MTIATIATITPIAAKAPTTAPAIAAFSLVLSIKGLLGDDETRTKHKGLFKHKDLFNDQLHQNYDIIVILIPVLITVS